MDGQEILGRSYWFRESGKECETKNYLAFLKTPMEASARALEFDKAVRYRDEIRRIEVAKRTQSKGSILKRRKK